MAEPKTPDKNAMFPEVQKGTVQPKAWQFGWVWMLMALFFIFLWFAGWGWGGYGGWLWGRHPVAATTTSTAAAAPTPVAAEVNSEVRGAGVPILVAQDKQPFIGKKFAVSNVLVESKPTDGTFWIGTRNSTPAPNAPPMLVVMTGPKNTTWQPPALDERVAVIGTVEKAPPAAEAKKEWSLSSSEADRLEKEGVYIQAPR